MPVIGRAKRWLIRRWPGSVSKAFLLMAWLGTAACGSPTRPSLASTCPPGIVSKGSMSAQIDGAQWIATCVAYASYTPASGSLYIAGLDNALDSGRAQAITFLVHSTQ